MSDNWETPLLANITEDFWELRSGEKSHEENPEKFWIPTRNERDNLKKGMAARLIFDIETEDENGKILTNGERMWVIVLSKKNDYYLGILSNEPASVEPDTGYLKLGSKLWFKAEHVIDIDTPPKEYLIEEFPDEFIT